MKITWTIAALLMLVPMASAANKDFPPVYNLTGTVKVWIAQHDYNSTVTVDGHTSFMGCNVSGNNVVCDDVTGGYTVKLADGHTYVLSNQPFVFRFGKYATDDWMGVSPTSPLASDGLTFQYRLMTIKGKDNLSAGSYFCVSSPTPVKHGLSEEICYTTVGLLP